MESNEPAVEGDPQLSEKPPSSAPGGVTGGDLFTLEDDEEQIEGEGEELTEDAEALKEELEKIVVVPPEPVPTYVYY